MSILAFLIVVLVWVIYGQHRKLQELGAIKEELTKAKADLLQLQLLADHIRQYEVIGIGAKDGSVFSYVSAFHPLRQN